ncbi:high-affinity nitrate transporter 3.2-like [Rosa chinensis]|uniref:high-affinity nitrate transporter 3.2-like n=1 Tax=Rosa chinensis TaxID=74649 RepID=UPI001AD8D655|nr:high-affinity nitrate transporter 3.2-like [Rosa chinensis]
MASLGRILLASLLLLFLAETAYGGILLSSLPNTLDVFVAAQKPGQAGEDKLGAVWSLNNRSFPVGTDAAYKTVNLKLCYAPYYESTLDRHVPIASYFVRAYVNDSAGVLVAYGQSTGPKKDYNILEVEASSGSRKTIDICFGAFSVLFLVAFFVV